MLITFLIGPPLSWSIYELMHIEPDYPVLQAMRDNNELQAQVYAALECPHPGGKAAIAEFTCAVITTLPFQSAVRYLHTHLALVSTCIIPNCDSEVVFGAFTTMLISLRYCTAPCDLTISAELVTSVIQSSMASMNPDEHPSDLKLGNLSQLVFLSLETFSDNTGFQFVDFVDCTCDEKDVN